MKIVINSCFGGFNLSEKALEMLNCESGFEYEIHDSWRTDEKLVKVVEELGEEASGDDSELVVVTVPDEATDWEIIRWDGMEKVHYVLGGKIYRISIIKPFKLIKI